MELLPPVGWADVATKQDLAMLGESLEKLEGHLDKHFDARFESGFRKVIVTMTTLLIGGFLATMLSVVLAVALRQGT